MVQVISSKNKYGFIYRISILLQEGNPIYPLRLHNNNIVAYCILNSVSKLLFMTVIYSSTARYSQIDLARFVGLLLSTRWSKNLSSLNTFLECVSNTRLVSIHRQSKYVLTFLIRHNESIYSQIRGQILRMNPLPSIFHVSSLVLQEEKRELGILGSNFSTRLAFSVKS